MMIPSLQLHPNNLRAYLACLRIRIQSGLAYRAAAWAGMATQCVWGLMQIVIFHAFYASTTTAQPMSLAQITSYIWLQQGFLAVLALWHRDSELFEMITSGNVAYELCRPLELYSFWYMRLLGARIAAVCLRVVPVLLLGFALPAPYGLLLPASALSLFAFAASLALGTCINIAIAMLSYVITFKTLNPSGSTLLFTAMGELFSGLLIPIPLMPLWLQHVVSFLPYRYAVDYPLRMYMGSVPLSEVGGILLLQLIWLALLVLIGRIGMARALRRTVLQGG